MKQFTYFILVSLVFTFPLKDAKAVKIDHHNESITDDEMAKSLKYSKPPAIKEDVLDKMAEELASYGKVFSDVTEIDLSSNLICTAGATSVMNFLIENREDFTALEFLNLAYNRIGERPESDYDEFRSKLYDVLEIFPSLKIDLKGNYLSLIVLGEEVNDIRERGLRLILMGT